MNYDVNTPLLLEDGLRDREPGRYEENTERR
jgi:hypothetical protein